jgi:hypothetical protein
MGHRRAQLEARPDRKRKRRKRLLEDEWPVTSSTKCTAELTKRFCKLIRKGHPPDSVCDFLGISTHTFWEWTRRGQLWLAGHEGFAEQTDDTSVDVAYAHFFTAFRRAFAQYKMQRVDRMHARRNSNWYREMAILERRDRGTWGRRELAGGSEELYDPDDRFL